MMLEAMSSTIGPCRAVGTPMTTGAVGRLATLAP
jgi:hypothetical protein